jgi:hypothetical protein
MECASFMDMKSLQRQKTVGFANMFILIKLPVSRVVTNVAERNMDS